MWTDADAAFYTHVIHLDVDVDDVLTRWTADEHRPASARRGAPPSREAVADWRTKELLQLRALCTRNRLPLVVVAPGSPSEDVAAIVQDILRHSPAHNTQVLDQRMRQHFEDKDFRREDEPVLVFDGDRTLLGVDTAVLYWQLALSGAYGREAAWLATHDPYQFPPKSVFKANDAASHGTYGYGSFRQLAFVYASIPRARHVEMCEEVTRQLALDPQWVALVDRVRRAQLGRVVVVTSGILEVWQLLVAKTFGSTSGIPVIGGSRIEDGLVVGASDKTHLVEWLKRRWHGTRVVVFGDSVVDLGMLRAAHYGYLVVGTPGVSSNSIDAHADALAELALTQVLMPATPQGPLPPARGIANSTAIPDAQVVDHVVHRLTAFRHFTAVRSAQLLANRTRDAQCRGLELLQSHRRVGKYLGERMVDDERLVLEQVALAHVVHGMTGATGWVLPSGAVTIVVPRACWSGCRRLRS